MLLINAVKTICDFLFFFSFASLFIPCSESWLLLGLILSLAFLSSMILQKTGGGTAARILCGLLPALGLFAARSLGEVILMGIVLSFYLVLTVSGKNAIEYEDYKYWYGISAVPTIVVLAICLSKWPIRPLSAVCAALYLFLGVLVLRRKRMGAGAGVKLRLMNLAELTGIAVLTVLACALLFAAVRYSGKVLEALLMPFGFLINAFVFLLDKFIGLFKPWLPDEPLIPEETQEVTPKENLVNEIIQTDPRDEAIFAPVERWIQILTIVLALVFLAFLLYRFYRIIQNARLEKTDGAAAFEERNERALRFRRSRRRIKRPALPSNNEKIRMIYKEYLFYVKICGVEIVRQTTSEDVLKASDGLSAAGEAERLRELYIRARYHNSEEMSDAEADEAKALLASIREQIEAWKASRRAAEDGVKAI